ncbi:somatostatin receptor type 1-like [Patiria miniata]|uniref:G-protein coupled receptors family 1 profile domain-containing protein n=1 Tax=Patiria miniata TaxID=46514 RepID=A0A914AJZ6_PATMI|nr:somatostatin receptor type 1-like [Patiria miniata]
MYAVFEALFSVVGSLGFIGNVLVCVTICYTKALHSITNLFILNLAVADALASVAHIAVPFAFHHFDVELLSLNKDNVTTTCTPELVFWYDVIWVVHYLGAAFVAHSVLGLTLTTYERFIGIVRPLHYTSYFSQRKIVVMLLAMWVTPLVVELPRFVYTIIAYWHRNCVSAKDSDEYYYTFSILSMVLLAGPTGAMVWMYVQILKNLKQGAKNLQQLGVKGSAKELLEAHKKVTVAMAVITAAFFILVLPAKIFQIVIAVNSEVQSLALLQTSILLVVLNSAINPVLYGFKYKQLRESFVSMVMGKCRKLKRQNHVEQAPRVEMVQTVS